MEHAGRLTKHYLTVSKLISIDFITKKVCTTSK